MCIHVYIYIYLIINRVICRSSGMVLESLVSLPWPPSRSWSARPTVRPSSKRRMAPTACGGGTSVNRFRGVGFRMGLWFRISGN